MLWPCADTVVTQPLFSTPRFQPLVPTVQVGYPQLQHNQQLMQENPAAGNFEKQPEATSVKQEQFNTSQSDQFSPSQSDPPACQNPIDNQI